MKRLVIAALFAALLAPSLAQASTCNGTLLADFSTQCDSADEASNAAAAGPYCEAAAEQYANCAAEMSGNNRETSLVMEAYYLTTSGYWYIHTDMGMGEQAADHFRQAIRLSNDSLARKAAKPNMLKLAKANLDLATQQLGRL